MSLASHEVIPRQMSDWSGKMEPITDHLGTHECPTNLETSQDKSSDTHLDS